MGARIRAHDWSSSSLGAPETWSASLRSALGICLNTPIVSAVLWGRELRILYNDAYARALAERHPWALGRPFGEVWAELWDMLGPRIASVLETGQGFSTEPQRLPMNRRGRLEDTWWVYSFAPLRDDDGAVAGIFVTALDETAAYVAQDALRDSEARFRALVNASSDVVYRMSPDWTEMRQLDGRGFLADTEQPSIRWLDAYILPEDRPHVAAMIDEAVRTKDVFELQHRVRRADGGVGWTFSRAVPVFDADGGIIEWFGMASDVSARKAGQAAVLDAEERLRLATDNAEVGFWDVDPINDRLIWPPRVKAMFGISPDVPVSMADFYAGLHPQDRERTAEAYAAAADPARRALYDVEYRTIGAEDGVVRWVAAKGRGLFDETGACVRVVGIAIDVTARKRNEAQNAALIALSDAIRDIHNPDDLAFAASSILGRTLGARRVGYAAIDPEAESLHVERDWTAAGVGPLTEPLQLRDYGSFVESLKRGEFISIADVRADERTAAAAGTLERRGVRSFITMPVLEQGRLGAVLFVNHGVARAWTPDEIALVKDVGARTLTAVERLRAGMALRESEARMRELNETLEAQVADRTSELRFHRDIIEATTSPICAFDLEYRLIAFNAAHNREFRRVNGFDTKLGDVFPDQFIPEQQPVMRALMSRALAGEQFTVTEEFGRPEFGQPLWEIHYTPLRDASGAIIGAFHLATDISDRLRAEADLAATQEALRQSQKMEAMGSLTGGVAHDFNNLLTPIVGSLDMLQRKGLGGEREQRLIAGAVQSAERAKTLVQRLLAFARRQPLQPTAVDLAPLVRGMAELVSSTTGPQIKVAVDAPEGLPHAKADPNQLEMAILNLAVNARDAMPDGGTLRISVEAETVGSSHRAAVPSGTYLKVSVADTGEGMDDATLKRAVEPFFSTKGIGKGTGLGLSMVHGLASQLGGALTISSTRGLGTNVELWLPSSTEPHAVAEPILDSTPPAPEGSGTALLVDDEELVRLSTADMLGELGYTVVEAASGEDALRLIEQGLNPQLLVTDHMMPGMSGTELARRLRDSRPGAKVLVVSGYAEADGVDPDLPRLTKPFRSADLATSLAALA